MVPAGVVFSVVSLTDVHTLPFARHRQNDKSKIEQKSIDLCGIASIGNILSSFGGLSLIESHSTKHACFVCTLSAALAAKCAIPSGESAKQCGPRATASQILDFDHGLLVFVGHPNVAHSFNNLAAGCWSARPDGHMELRWVGQAA